MSNQFKYPILKAFSKPFWDVTDNLKIFGVYSFITALMMVVLAFIFHQTFLCSFLSDNSKITCSGNVVLYMVYVCLKILLLSVYLRIWYDKIYLQKNIDIKYIKQNFIRFLTFWCGIVIFLGANMLPIMSFYLLAKRVPNPVWQAELGYFTVVSIGFIIPFIMLRFYTNLAELIEAERFNNFKSVAQKTAYQFSKILFSFALLMMTAMSLFLVVTGNLRAHIGTNIYVYNLFAEFAFEWSFILIATLFINFIRTQKEIFES